MEFQQSSNMSFDASPTESFVSTPGETYSPLFAVTTPTGTGNTMNPMEIMTPQSFTDEKSNGQLPLILEEASSPSSQDIAEATSTASEKKPVKKRKSWGQVLPEPKTNLPPRKRAKTDDEKEQRRVERVLRNRRAAQSSRERKRLEVEGLEHCKKNLESVLAKAIDYNARLLDEIARLHNDPSAPRHPLAHWEQLRINPVTLSQELFSSQDTQTASNPDGAVMNQLLASEDAESLKYQTVNPASLSPEIGPVPDSTNESEDVPVEQSKRSLEKDVTTSSDLAQFIAVPTTTGLDSRSSVEDIFTPHIDNSFNESSATDPDYIFDSGLPATSNTIFDDYMITLDSGSMHHQAAMDLFDINDYLNEDHLNVGSDVATAKNNAAAELTHDF